MSWVVSLRLLTSREPASGYPHGLAVPPKGLVILECAIFFSTIRRQLREYVDFKYVDVFRVWY